MKIPCRQCGIEIERDVDALGAFAKMQAKWTICGKCSEIQAERNSEEENARAQSQREASWLNICPPLYRNTDAGHSSIPQKTLKYLLEWNDRGDGMSVGLHGKTGRCKTRMMFLLLHRLHMDGVRVFAVSSKRLGSCFSRSFGESREADEARQIMHGARTAQVLFLDDLGKEKFTEHVESEFYDLIEHRTSHLKPTLWTANAVGKELEDMMTADRGSAIIRRLREFSLPIEV